jgi:TolC family type I secretion outer membrane protein
MFVSAMVLVSIAGCLSAPKIENSSTPWTPPSRARGEDRVWTAVRQQKADFTNNLTLAEISDIALQNNPATAKAWSDAKAAAAQVEQAKGYFMPTITASAGEMIQRVDAEPATYNQRFTKFNPGLQINYLIINFGGGQKAAVEEALQTVYATDFAFNKSIQDVLLAVETAYYTLFSAESNLEAAQASVKDAKSVLDATQERQKQGLGTALDVLQTQALYDQSLFNLASAQGALASARGSLAQTLGLPADVEIHVAVPAYDLPEAVKEADLKQTIDDSLARRPDIASARATVAAKEAAITVAGAYLWPSLYLNGSVTRDYYNITEMPNLQDRDWSYNGTLSIQWPLFDGFQTISEKHAARAQAESAAAQLKQAELAASADVWMRYHNYETALKQHTFAAAFLKSSSAAYDLTFEGFKAGIKSMLDLLDAERQLAQARSQYVTARQGALIALVNLAYSTGLLEKGGDAKSQEMFSTPTPKDTEP